jgi:hypothetical protein
VRGTTQGVVVELLGDPARIDAAVVWLQSRGAAVQPDGLRLVVLPADAEADPDALFDEVRDAVVAHDLSIRRLQPHRATLEDVFLNADAATLPVDGPAHVNGRDA